MKTVPFEGMEGKKLAVSPEKKVDPKANKTVDDAAKKLEEELMGTLDA